MDSFILLLIIGCSKSDISKSPNQVIGIPEKEDSTTIEPKRVVKSISTTLYNYMEKFGEIVELSRTNYVTIYDSSGKVIEGLTYSFEQPQSDSGRILVSRTITKYNSLGNIIEESSFDSTGLLESKSISKYDSSGKLIEESGCGSDGIFNKKTSYEYDLNGNNTGIFWYDSTGRLRSNDIYQYDSTGNKTEWSWYISDKLYIQVTSKYDSLGKIIEGLHSHPVQESSNYKIFYTYNSDGNIVEKSEYRLDGTVREKNITKYDSVGNKIEMSEYNSDGELRTNHKFDFRENEIERLEYRWNGLVKVVTNYDSRGNLIEKSKYSSDRINHLIMNTYNDKNRLVENEEYEFEFKFGENQKTPTKKKTYEYVLY